MLFTRDTFFYYLGLNFLSFLQFMGRFGVNYVIKWLSFVLGFPNFLVDGSGGIQIPEQGTDAEGHGVHAATLRTGLGNAEGCSVVLDV